MSFTEILYKTRDGKGLSKAEIDQLIFGYTAGEIEDYQMAAWAMAVYFRGMNEQEVVWLTEAMVASGQRIDLSAIPGPKVDKHSTGGVGDTTTLVLAPLVAAAGLPVAKLSGRGLGHTGGTIDKLESIPGFRVDFSIEEFSANVNKVGVSIAGQTVELAPADGKLYSLRDVTGTVDSIPLIASSIMCKKIAAGANALVLDVKVGNGAFMAEPDKGKKLAETMVRIGENLGLHTLAVLTAMDRPLGRAVGNALEVKEAIEVLRGGGPDDLRELCLLLGCRMLAMAGVEKDLAAGYRRLEHLLSTGAALQKFKQLIDNQGGETEFIDNPHLLPTAKVQVPVVSSQGGWVVGIDTAGIGKVAQILGAGRDKIGQAVDLGVGLEILIKPGQKVAKNQTLAIIHANTQIQAEGAQEKVAACYSFGEMEVKPLPLIIEEVGRLNQ